MGMRTYGMYDICETRAPGNFSISLFASSAVRRQTRSVAKPVSVRENGMFFAHQSQRQCRTHVKPSFGIASNTGGGRLGEAAPKIAQAFV